MNAGDNTESHWIPAQWSAPVWIRAGTTTRHSGYSRDPFAGFNLALHVGDDNNTVQRNRAQLLKISGITRQPLWLNQVHGNRLVCAHDSAANTSADGSYTNQPGIICVVLTADCVPVLLCNRSGTQVAAIHAGWRGLCTGIVANAVQLFTDNDADLIAWLGPHISPANYEVGADIRNACIKALTRPAEQAFTETRAGHWNADLDQLARLALQEAGVLEIFSCNRCTCREEENFFSYRRDKQTGRMASLIWMEAIHNT